MSQKNVRKGEIKIPEIGVRNMFPNEHRNYVMKEVDECMTAFYGRKIPDLEDLSVFACYCYQNVKDKDLMVLIALTIVWGFVLDDVLDEDPQLYLTWIKVLEQEKSISDTPLEKMYLYFWDKLKRFMSSSQKRRWINYNIGWMRTFNSLGDVKSGKQNLSPEKLIEYRLRDCGKYILDLLAEIGVGTDLNELNELETVLKLHKNAGIQMLIINDIYSFPKEMKCDGGRYNYIYILSEKHDITFEEAIKIAVRDLDFYNQEIIRYIREIREKLIPVPEKYIDEILAIRDGNHYWSKTCERYKV